VRVLWTAVHKTRTLLYSLQPLLLLAPLIRTRGLVNTD
jgi:hypothetical protein